MTLKQVIQRLTELAESHQQINHFFIGGFDEFLDNEDVVYPALFCELKSDSTISLADRVANFNFTFYFFDLMDTANRSLQNIWDVTSDMSSVAQDYIALLKDQDYTDWEIGDDYDMTIREYELQDLTCGVSVDVTIGIRFDANRCQVPNTFSFSEYDGSSLTLKQIVERIQDLALSHKQINHFFIGNFDEFLDGPDVVYPALFAELDRSGVVSLPDRLCTYSFTFHLFDLMDIANRSLQNEFEIKSDMVSIAMDFLAMLNYFGFQNSWIISEDYNMSIRDYQLEDLTGGVSIKVDISSKFDANRCQVPTTYVFNQQNNNGLTLKQVIKRIEQLVVSHKQINHFFIGSFDEFLDNEDVIYPACFVELDQLGNINLTNRLATYSFTFYFLDLLDISNRSLKNEFEIKSDMSSVAQDVLAMLNYTGFQSTWEIGTNYNLNIVDYELQDLTAGVSVKVNISTRFDANKCQVPLVPTDDGNFLLWADGQYYLINDNDKLIYAE
jgi:hypothetical protein